MKRLYTFLVVAFMLLSCSRASAYEAFTYSFDTVFSIANSVYSKVTVLDLRKDKEDLGFVRTSVVNKKRPLTVDNGIAAAIQTYLQNCIAGGVGNNYTLVIALYDYRLEDRPNADEIGTFYIDADCYLGKDERYAYAGTIDSIREVRSSWDVTKMLIRASQYSLSQYFSFFAHSNPEALPQATYTINDIEGERTKIKKALPIYNTTNYKKGVYYTAEQFLQNQPGAAEFRQQDLIDEGINHPVFYTDVTKQNKKGNKLEAGSFFAVYTGEVWYVCGHTRTIKMKFEDGDFYANKSFEGFAKKEMTSAAMMFGLAGAIAQASMDKNRKAYGLYKSRFSPATLSFHPVRRLL